MKKEKINENAEELREKAIDLALQLDREQLLAALEYAFNPETPLPQQQSAEAEIHPSA